MTKYIDFNTEKKRASAANSFEKDFVKLMINVYGKKQWKFYKKE